MRSLLILFATLLSAASVATQTASFTNYGRGCDLPGSPPPLIRSTGLPQLGATFTVRYIGPNGQTPVSQDQPVLLTGFSTLSWPIPPISSLQPAGCLLLVLPEIVIPMPWTGSRYQDQFPMQIPNDVGLLGATMHQQFACFYSRCQPTCNLQMLRMSDAGTTVIGV